MIVCHSPTQSKPEPKLRSVAITDALVASGYGVSIVPTYVCQPRIGTAAFVGIDGDPSISNNEWNDGGGSPVIGDFAYTLDGRIFCSLHRGFTFHRCGGYHMGVHTDGAVITAGYMTTSRSAHWGDGETRLDRMGD